MTILEKFQQGAAQRHAELGQRHGELEAQAEKARQVQEGLSRLQRDLDDAADSLARADTQLAVFKTQLAQLQENFVELWCLKPFGQLQTPQAIDYSYVCQTERAIADFNRVRPILQERVKSAQAALDTFQQKHREFFN